jgi:hypothetical protein
MIQSTLPPTVLSAQHHPYRGSLLAGHVTVEDRALISGNCVVHQFCRRVFHDARPPEHPGTFRHFA